MVYVPWNASPFLARGLCVRRRVPYRPRGSKAVAGCGTMAMSYAFVWDDHGVTENKAVDPGRLTDGVSIGLLATVFPDERVVAAIEEAGVKERRNRVLPALVDGVLRARAMAGFRQRVCAGADRYRRLIAVDGTV